MNETAELLWRPIRSDGYLTVCEPPNADHESSVIFVWPAETPFEADQDILAERPSDPTAQQHMRIIEASGILDFWDDPGEDIYSPENGEPL